MKENQLKKILLCIVWLMSAHLVFAQADSLPIFRRFPNVPPFTIMSFPDSTAFKKEDLSNRTKLMLVIFSPDCDHCRHFTSDLLKHYDLFKKVQIVMASSMDYSIIKQFYTEFNIAQYPAIHMGRDVNYFLGTFFQVTQFPSVFLYDKKGKLIQDFSGTIDVEKLASFY
ncbi:MAG TPA: thioredoxin domain-containing protein [Ferruginibacter sp.]|nr:thioredoxin domain-containing protein [Ferruginibacter sp.]